MAPRLLSLLSLVESSLLEHEAPSVAKGRAARTVNFHKGLARLSFNDGSGAILLQSFTLADGQICVKAMLEWTGVAQPGMQAVYPTDSFNWGGAACRIAEAWMDGPPPAAAAMNASVEVSRDAIAEQQKAEAGFAATA